MNRTYKYRLSGNSSVFIKAEMKQLPELKVAFPEYHDINSQVLQNVIERLDWAFRAFFRRVKNGDKPGDGVSK